MKKVKKGGKKRRGKERREKTACKAETKKKVSTIPSKPNAVCSKNYCKNWKKKIGKKK